MRAQLVSAVGAVAILTVGAVGCAKDDSSSDAKTTSATTSAAATTSSAPTAPTGGAGAKVTVDGQPKQVDGAVVCSTTDGKFSIAIGDVNGVVLSFTDGVPGDTATATKDGNTYTIKGNASGSGATGKQVSKPFEIVATCP